MFDFDGVISKGRFYVSTKYQLYPQIQIIRKHLFEDDNQDVIRAWMKGEITYQRIHQQLSEKTGIDVKFLNYALKQSVREIKLNKEILDFSNTLRARGVKSVIVTDNMDIFDQQTVPFHKLNKYFDHIYSSSQHGLMKNEEGGEIFKRILRDFHVDPSEVAFTDDSSSTGEIAQTIGIKFFLFQDYEKSFPIFQEWIKQNFKKI